jgi:hypothetical protein
MLTVHMFNSITGAGAKIYTDDEKKEHSYIILHGQKTYLPLSSKLELLY